MSGNRKRVLVAGMGKSGLAAMRALQKEGAEVSLYDAKTEAEMDPEIVSEAAAEGRITYWGELPPETCFYDEMIISPGIPPASEIFQYGKDHAENIMGELELAYRLSKGKGHYVAITGTNGKTTTTTLVGEIMQRSGRDTRVVGNIGTPVVYAAENAAEETWLVAEVSSFQLETTDTFHPTVSAILNITPDHLNWHQTMENYIQAKAKVYACQTREDYCVVNADNAACEVLAADCPATVIPFSRLRELSFGCFVRQNAILLRKEGGREILLGNVQEIPIPGTHNLENVLAAAAICYYAGVEPETIRAGIAGFQGVEHRIEWVGEWNGVKFYNDSKGTNTDAAQKAIDALGDRLILLAGGYDKGESFDAMVKSFQNRVKHVFLLGETAEKIARACDAVKYTNYSIRETLAQCVQEACVMATPGDTVLLSPACASWDMFRSYEERGRQFKDCVRQYGRKE